MCSYLKTYAADFVEKTPIPIFQCGLLNEISLNLWNTMRGYWAMLVYRSKVIYIYIYIKVIKACIVLLSSVLRGIKVHDIMEISICFRGSLATSNVQATYDYNAHTEYNMNTYEYNASCMSSIWLYQIFISNIPGNHRNLLSNLYTFVHTSQLRRIWSSWSNWSLI